MSLPQINHVVGIGQLDCQIDLIQAAQSQFLYDSVYNPRKLPWLRIKKEFPAHILHVYSSGKFRIVGTNSIEDAKEGSQWAAHDLSQWLNKKIKLKNFRIVNIIAHCNVDHLVNLAALSDHKLSYKHDNMSGVFFKLGKPIETIRVFHSGKLQIFKATTYEDILEAFEIMKEILATYKYKGPQ